MKKTLLNILLALLLLCFCSCGKKVPCDFCDNEYRENKMHEEDWFGFKIYLCDRCYEGFNKTFDEFLNQKGGE